jgi:hypothetical protein
MSLVLITLQLNHFTHFDEPLDDVDSFVCGGFLDDFGHDPEGLPVDELCELGEVWRAVSGVQPEQIVNELCLLDLTETRVVLGIYINVQ